MTHYDDDPFELLSAKDENFVEVRALQQFASALPSGLPVGKLRKTEAPDFIIDRSSGGRLGIELMRFPNDEAMAEVRLQRRVYNLVMEAFDRKLWLDIGWRSRCGPPPVQKLVDEILRIIESSASLPNFGDEEIRYSYRDYLYSTNPGSYRKSETLPSWKKRVSQDLIYFPKFVMEIEFELDDNPVTVGPGESAEVPILTPQNIRRRKSFVQKMEKVQQYRKKCEECWLLIHTVPFGTAPLESSEPTIPTCFEIAVESFRVDPLETEFDALWLLDEQGTLIRADLSA